MKRVREVLGAKRLFRDHWIICTENSDKESRIDAKSPFPKSNAIFLFSCFSDPFSTENKEN